MPTRIVLACAFCASLFIPLLAMESGSVPAENEALVPRHLLSLLHAPEVHQELKLSAAQVTKLETYFGEIDGVWFRSRLLPVNEQSKVVRELEERTHAWLRQNLDTDQINRLRQLECQAQSIRMMCRSDVARDLSLSPEQQQKFIALARETQSARSAVTDAADQSAKSKAEQAVKAEQDALQTVLTVTQHNRMWELLGSEFATNTLRRVYPMAPEFVLAKHWINSPPVTLRSLRGKVVLVHFYAFQCHNCHANFSIYKRWHDQLRSKGVAVVGIQTPETSSERDPDLVGKAAADRELKFPILVDLESANWQAWGNTMWPTVYVVDKRGYLRYWWQGEMNWQGATGDKTVEDLVERLLAE